MTSAILKEIEKSQQCLKARETVDLDPAQLTMFLFVLFCRHIHFNKELCISQNNIRNLFQASRVETREWQMYGQFLQDIFRPDLGKAQLCHNTTARTYTVSNKKAVQ